MRNILNGLCLGVGILLYSLTPAVADDQLRELFLDAEAALNKNNIALWEKLSPRLKNYPLLADLQFKSGIQTIDRANSKQADSYLAALSDTPLRKTYLRSWLRRLYSRKHWKKYTEYYETELGTRYQCHYTEALYKTGQPDEAFFHAKKLWLVGKSQIKQCDPVFKLMRQEGHLNDSLIWERIELAIRKGQPSLVKYLRRSLPKHEQQQVTEWLSIRHKPERVLKKKYIQSEIPRYQKMLVYGIRRMALFEADKALNEWTKIRTQVLLPDEDIENIEQYIALRLTTQRIDGAVTQHKRVTNQDQQSLEWAARAALREQNFVALESFIDQMGNVADLSDRWKYWKAKTAQSRNDQITASTIFHTLASGRGYHNFLAADEINNPYQFNNKPLTYAEGELDTLERHYNVRRAKELYELDRISEARREWYFLIKKFGDEDRQKLAYIQKQWGWDSQAILTIATADYYDDLSLRFPVAYKQPIDKYAGMRNLDPSWVMALMRQESAFQPDARSSAGARGLMQLMPATSRLVARQLRTKRPKIRDLYQPEKNVQLGTQYLKSNLKRFDQNKVLTTAAYNAGPHRVKTWLEKSPEMSADEWVETIPFKETRTYVQRIMSYASIYDHQLGKTVKRLLERMPDITP